MRTSGRKIQILVVQLAKGNAASFGAGEELSSGKINGRETALAAFEYFPAFRGGCLGRHDEELSANRGRKNSGLREIPNGLGLGHPTRNHFMIVFQLQIRERIRSSNGHQGAHKELAYPECVRIDIYESVGGYQALRKAFRELSPADDHRDGKEIGLRGGAVRVSRPA